MGADGPCLRVRFRGLGGVGYQSVVGCQLVGLNCLSHTSVSPVKSNGAHVFYK